MPEIAKVQEPNTNFKFHIGDRVAYYIKETEDVGGGTVVDRYLMADSDNCLSPRYWVRRSTLGSADLLCREDQIAPMIQLGPPTPPDDHVMPGDASPPAQLYSDTNPKSRVGRLKAPMELIPSSARMHLAMALNDGAHKYGPYNWRDNKVSAMVYIGAMERHLLAYTDGENEAEDSGVHHLAHAMACAAILLDAEATGNLIDDRPRNGAAPSLLAAMHKKLVARYGAD